jgi:DNA-binding beta-propeller fold protein YncE
MRTTTTLALVSLVACGGDATPAPATPSAANAPPPTPTPPPAPEAATAPPAPAAPASSAAKLDATPIALPGVTGSASLDYIAFDRARGKLWVPVGATGSIDVLDAAAGTFTRIDGFKTVEREMRPGQKRMLGPSAASVADGVVYVGDRANNEICAIDAATLKRGKCTTLPSPTDGVAWVASAKEVWVTTPKDQSLTVLDAGKPGTLEKKTVIKTEGAPEGFAVDDKHGLFFTNLEDKDLTLAIDIKTHKTKATWKTGCGGDGPRGIAYDATHDFVVVGCTDHLQVLDAGHDGAALGKLDTGAGVDNIDLVDGKIYAAAGKAAKLTVATVDDKGQLAVFATGETSEGARNAVADASGVVYVADAPKARILVMKPAK